MKLFWWIFLFFFIITSVFLVFQNQAPFEYAFSQGAQLGGAKLSLAVIKEKTDLIRGFSSHPPIKADQGLLFVFDSANFHGIWMKDMNFSLDIIWLNEKKEIVSIRENFSPETYPEVAYPDAKSLYVLEVSSGFVRGNKIRVGDRLEIDFNTPQNPLVKPL